MLLGAASKDDAIQCIRLRSRRAQASTFQSCEVPQFEWAAYGNRVTGRMYGMTAAVNDQHIFAAGYLKSTLDPEAAGFVESTADTPSQVPPLRTGTAAAR